MEVINRLRPKMNRLPIASAFLQPVQDLRIGGRSSAALYQYTIQADNINDLYHWGPILLANMKKLPGLLDVNTDQQNGGLQEMLTYDRVTAARLGQTAQSLDQSLYRAFGQSEVSVIYTQLNQYYVVMEVAPRFWQSPAGLKRIYFAPSSAGSTQAGINAISPLSSVMKTAHRDHASASQSHRLVSFGDGVFQLVAGHVAERRNPRSGAHGERLGMPSTVHGFFAGTAQAYQDSLDIGKVSGDYRATGGFHRAGNSV